MPLTTSSATRPKDWGVDLSPENRPGIPMETEPKPIEGSHWVKPERQRWRMNIVHRRSDLEQLTPVYGTAQPARGVSGFIRRAAYAIPDHRPSHWMTLMLADRVDGIQNSIVDLFTANSRAAKVEKTTAQKIATGLGWFSLALGTAEVIAPGTIASVSGIPPRKGLLRFFGIREIMAGMSIFKDPIPAGPVGMRVGGDALDLAALFVSFVSPRAQRKKLLTATLAVLGITALDAYAQATLIKERSEKHRSWRIA